MASSDPQPHLPGGRRRFDLTLPGGVLLVLLISLGHYLTPITYPQFHDALRRCYYLPIILVGLGCGLRAGLGVALLAAVTFVPHIYTHWHGDPFGAMNLDRTFEVALWLVVGLLAGLLADRERATRREAEAARDLAEARAQEASAAARELLQLRAQLQESDRMATLGLLAASLAHEVRNPLGSLKGIADMLRDDYSEDHPHRELVEILDTEVRRLDGVVAAVLSGARAPEDHGPASLQQGIRLVRRLLLTDGEVTLRVLLEEEDLLLPLSEGLLRQVLLNLLQNSLQALAGGGGEIRIHGQRIAGEGTTLVVEDDGPGFPTPDPDPALQPFFTTREGGTGLGLPITSRIVESHGGTLRLEPGASGNGARVVINFPEGIG